MSQFYFSILSIWIPTQKRKNKISNFPCNAHSPFNQQHLNNTYHNKSTSNIAQIQLFVKIPFHPFCQSNVPHKHVRSTTPSFVHESIGDEFEANYRSIHSHYSTSRHRNRQNLSKRSKGSSGTGKIGPRICNEDRILIHTVIGVDL